MVENAPLQDHFHRGGAHVATGRQLAGDADQVGETVPPPVRQHPGHGDVVHFGVDLVQFDKARRDVLAGQVLQGVFNDAADGRLRKETISCLISLRSGSGKKTHTSSS